MTEGSSDDGNYLVRVRAQVMTRDDSTGGWVPMSGGGLSHVSVRKRVVLPSPQSADESASAVKSEYIIQGKRIRDQCIALSCVIKRDFQYNKVMPTFHHWKTGDKKFGLTFQTAADASLFDRSIRNAIEDIDDIDPSQKFHDVEGGDDDVFVVSGMTIQLPIESRSSSDSSSGSAIAMGARTTNSTPSISGEIYSEASSPHSHSHGNRHLHCFHFSHHSHPSFSPNDNDPTCSLVGSVNTEPTEAEMMKTEDVWIERKTTVKEPEANDSDKIETISPSEPYAYVHFSKSKFNRNEHEYCYPTVESVKAQPGTSGCSSSHKKPYQVAAMGSSDPPLLPSKKKGKKRKEGCHVSPVRMQCRHCLDSFTEDDNPRGSCEYAPDKILKCINAATCISCAQCVFYHCMSDAEGDYDHHPCSCNSADNHCHRRWTGLALLSLFIPCLWCYLPLRACHRCGVSCGICGGKHEAP